MGKVSPVGLGVMMCELVPVPVRGVPVPGVGKNARRLRCSAHGDRAALISNRMKRDGRWGFNDAKLRERNGEASRSGRSGVRVNEVYAVAVGAVHCSANACWVDGKMAVVLV